MASQLQQARNHHARQTAIAVGAVTVLRRLFAQRRPWSEILPTLASYQLAAATAGADAMATQAGTAPTVSAAAFAGTSSAGFPLAEPIIATIDRFVPAPVEPLPAVWWDDSAAFMRSVEQLIESEVRDAGRAAFQAELVEATTHQNYVRVLTPPSCKRCVVLAGRIYRDLDGFERHPGDDCVHWPVQDWEKAHDAGLVSSPAEAFEKGLIRDLTAGERKAIEDGADITTVINSGSGMYTADVFGHRAKATHYGTTKRAAWRRQNPSRLIRLRPDAIYQFAEDRADARRLLRTYGYITT